MEYRVGETGRIVFKIRDYCSTDNPLRFAKPLKGLLRNSYRFRIGDYRAIFEIDRPGHISIVFVTHVGHRSEIYD
jgi:mRNA interferase RelE/StbE